KLSVSQERTAARQLLSSGCRLISQQMRTGVVWSL
ncbi:Hypothetical predicted protein, partial [Cloeon dipterum]